MKKLLIAVLLVCIGLLIADPIPIGEGVETNIHLPMEPFYGYTYSQVIYTAEEIGGAVNIENVAWLYNGAQAWTEDEVVIYMGHTTQDEFGTYPSWIPVAELTQVWSGPFTVMDFEHAVTIELDTIFEYNGTDNLVIAFDANTVGYHSSSAEFYCSATTLNRSIYFYSDSNNPDPADPPTGAYREMYDEKYIELTGKTMPRAASVQPYIANIIINNDATLPSGFVNGHVYDDMMNPIEGAQVFVGNFGAVTDAAGFYEVEVFVEGAYTVTADYLGYVQGTDEVDVVFGQTETIDFNLVPLPRAYVNGYVTASAGGDPIEGAVVTLGAYSGTAGTTGYYEFEVFTEGLATITANHPDYFPGVDEIDVMFGQTYTVDFALDFFDSTGDTIEDPIMVDAFPYEFYGDMTLYTDYSTGAGLDGSRTGADIYFQLDLDAPASLELHCCGTDFDTYMHLYDATLARVAWDDDGCSSWPSGSNMASWIGDGEPTVVPAGTYYVAVEAYSSYTTAGPFEVHLTELAPPAFGILEGTITDFDTTDPIEGALVNVGGFQAVTGADGFYQFELETGFYDIAVSADGYIGNGVTGVEVLADQTVVQDIALELNTLGGDTPATAIVIDAFPFFDSGDTNNYTNYIGNTSADVFYEFTLTEEMNMDILSCGSTFDTYLRLYDTAMTQIASNDDACSSWGTGSSAASWIGLGNGTIVPAGTYYVCLEGYSSNQGYYELRVEEILPPAYGDLEGYVTDAVTTDPIAGATVTVGTLTTTTDAMGWYGFTGLETGIYSVNYMATGYNLWTETEVEILDGQVTELDVALEPLTGVVFEVTVDSWPTEASWNVWDVAGGAYVWDVDFTFTTAGETQVVSEELADGSYEVHTWDSYGDGGIAGVVSKEGIILTQWATNDYTTNGVFPFYNGPIVYGTLEGTVTDNFTSLPIAGATVLAGDFYAYTDANGFYSFPELLVGTYDVYCGVYGYDVAMVTGVEILEDAVTVQDIGLDVTIEVPANLMAAATGYDVELTWDGVTTFPDDMLRWDDGTNLDAIGLTGGGTFYVAAAFPTTVLDNFDGQTLTDVTVYINDMPTEMILYVWSGMNAENVLVEQTVTPVAMDWNNFVLNTPVTIDASQDLWIGYWTSSVAGLEYTSGTDPGPAVAGYGDLLSMDGVAWESMAISYGLDYNWNIWGGVTSRTGERTVMARPQEWTPREVTALDHRAEFAAAGLGELTRDFVEYKVYRDGMEIATVTEPMYTDMALLAGVYEYYVTAYYDEGESDPSNMVVVDLGYADVSVNPTSLSETLDYGLTSDHTITVTNNGDGNFEWNGSIQQQVRYDNIITKPRTSTNENSEISSGAEAFDMPASREMWDILYNQPIGTDIVSQAGVEFDGTYIYTTVWNAATINKFDIDGNFIESFEIPGVAGLRDLAYDGQYFYGGAAGTSLWQMDFETQTLVSTITSPVAVRAIAYDDDMDGFWVNNWDTDITLVGRDGSTMDSFPCSTVYGSWYGMAYDNVTDGGPYIWGFSQDGSGAVINQMSIATGADTGVTRDVFVDAGSILDDIAGGLFTSADYADGTFVIGAFVQNSYTLVVYELTTISSWLSINPASGIVEPGESVEVTATFNAVELPGLTYFADIVFSDGEAMASVAADLTITGSIPTAQMTVDPLEFDVIVGADGTVDHNLTIGNDGDLALEYDAEIIYYEGRAVAEVYPQSADYWTGTTDGTSFTETSLVNATPTVGEGWMMFDVSGIPDGAIINSIECNVYVNDCNWPYWSLTPCTLDPLATDAATLAAHIAGNNPTGVAYSYNNESGTFAPGAYMYPLGGTANADLEAALADDWFAVGASPRDGSTTYYTIIDGWNEANPPYLVIDYSIPMNPWVTFDGNMMMDGMVEVGAGANAHNLHFDAAGLVDGDVMMGEIVLNSNDLYNEEMIIPVTMTVGQPYMYGDVTGDEVIDAFDAANILQYTVGMDPIGAPLPWTWQAIAGDVDGNGAPEAYDAALVLQYSVGMIEMFPVEARSEIAKAEVTLGAENGELVFYTAGNLYGFSVSTDSELIAFGEVETAYLSAANGNAFALASANAIEGDFLRIPFELLEDSGEITFTMTANGVSSEKTYNVEDLQGGIITANAVLGNYPNPFNPTTDIMLQVKEATNVKVDIYNVRGQLVKSLVNENVEMGAYSYTWSGTDNTNRPVSSGVYFYKVQMGSDNSTHKMIMLK